VIRRAEREISELIEKEPVNPEALKYANRLSDHLFVLGRTSTTRAAAISCGCPAPTAEAAAQRKTFFPGRERVAFRHGKGVRSRHATSQSKGRPMKVLVAVKRVVDYNVKIRIKPDGAASIPPISRCR
jgi:hypothetical protein